MRERAALLSLALLASAGLAGAQEPPAPVAGEPIPPSDPASREALEHFVKGTELARQARWAEALTSFERAAEIKPHAITTYNLAACERAIGRYTRARRLFLRALEQHRASGEAELPETLLTQTQTFLSEINGLLSRVSLTVVPAGAALSIDGRPLEQVTQKGAGTRATFVAGTREPGTAGAIFEPSFDVLLDPGAHVFTITRKGFEPAVLNRSFAPRARVSLRLELDRLPATLHIRSNQSGAIVALNGDDVGPVPVDLQRPAGTYRIEVKKDGFVAYETTVDLSPGEQANLRARLVEDKPSIVEQWWFWTTAGVVVTGGVVLTYVLTRPEPEPPPYDGGSTGWVVEPQTALFRW
jgi:hypothetical protein